jgi:hypothetical protein
MRLYAEEKLTERKVQQYTVEYFKETHYLAATLLLLYISFIPLTELLIRLNTGYEETLYHTHCTTVQGRFEAGRRNWGGNKITGANS